MKSVEAASPVRRFFLGYAFGASLFSIGLIWLPGALADFLRLSSVFSIGYVVIIIAYLALFPAFAAWLSGYIRVPLELRALLVWPALWSLMEFLRAEAVVGGLPWLSLGVTQIDGPLAGWAPIGGEFGLSFASVFCSGLIWLLQKALWNHSWRTLSSYLIVSVAFGLVSFQLLDKQWTQLSNKTLKVALIQSSFSQSERGNPVFRDKIISHFERHTKVHLGEADLIIWPETATPLHAEQLHHQFSGLFGHAGRRDTAVLVGTLEHTVGGGEYNSAVLYGPSGRNSYRKRHLVPFGEVLPPLFSWLHRWWHNDLRLLPGMRVPVFRIGDMEVVPTICWEILFSRDVLRRVNLNPSVLVNIGNEGWTLSDAARQRNLQVARLRAIETGRPLVRVMNAGYSAVIGPTGKTYRLVKPGQLNERIAVVRPSYGETPFVAAGPDLMAVLDVVLLMLSMVFFRVHRNVTRMHEVA